MPVKSKKKSPRYVEVKETDQYGYLRRIREADSPTKLILEAEQDPLRLKAKPKGKTSTLNYLDRETLRTSQKLGHLGLE